jgi:hypothetical protein
MIDSKANKQPKSKIVVGPKSSTSNVAMKPDTLSSHDRTRERAYELYEKRGREPGQDEQDWLRAELEIVKRER